MEFHQEESGHSCMTSSVENQEARHNQMQVKYSMKQTNLRPILISLAPSTVLCQSYWQGKILQETEHSAFCQN